MNGATETQRHSVASSRSSSSVQEKSVLCGSVPLWPRAPRLSDERGAALIIALLAMLLLTALGLALTLTTTTETKITANYRDGQEALYAADAAAERILPELLSVPDWNTLLSGTVQSSFIDGAPGGVRAMPNGTTIDLAAATNLVNCGKTSTCGDADMNAVTDERPWGTGNPRWQLYAYGPMQDMVPTGTINSPFYVVVWVGDDPSENDSNPLVDGGTPTDGSGTNKGKGVISLLARAYGSGGVSRVVEVTVAQTDTTEIERGYTGQRGQDEQNRRARKAAVQATEKALTRSTIALQ